MPSLGVHCCRAHGPGESGREKAQRPPKRLLPAALADGCCPLAKKRSGARSPPPQREGKDSIDDDGRSIPLVGYPFAGLHWVIPGAQRGESDGPLAMGPKFVSTNHAAPQCSSASFPGVPGGQGREGLTLKRVDPAPATALDAHPGTYSGGTGSACFDRNGPCPRQCMPRELGERLDCRS